MPKIQRKMIRIDEEKCNGCGLCIPACPEGALQIIDGKARVVKENFCDGLGACLGDCPQDALSIIESEVEKYDEEGVINHIKKNSPGLLERHLSHIEAHKDELAGILSPSRKKDQPTGASFLGQWPIQLHLVSADAPFLKDSDLAVIADCVPYACATIHRDFLKDHTIVIACPKLDNLEGYEEKLANILSNAQLKSIKVIHMEVPCCFGLVSIVQNALSKTGNKVPFEAIVIGLKGEIQK